MCKNSEKCIFCNAPSEHNRGWIDDDRWTLEEEYFCPNHGYYNIKFKRDPEEENTIKELIGENFVPLSGYLYECHQHETKDDPINIELNKDTILEIIKDPTVPKTPMQKLNKIILYIYSQNSDFDSHVDYSPSGIGECEKISIPTYAVYAKNEEELRLMFEELCKMEYLKKDESECKYIVTCKGLEYAESLASSNKNSNKVFVAMRFQDDMKDMLKNAIKPACSDCGFDAYTVDEMEHNNNINDEIVAGLKTSRFVIADFTYNNNGVYFEAGYSEGKGIEVIRTCNKKYYDDHKNDSDPEHRLHFDVNHYNFIFWENESDFKKKLVDRIRHTIL